MLFLKTWSSRPLAKNSGRPIRRAKSEGGQKFLSPNPLHFPFCPPERSVSAARSAAISQDFVQKRFALRSAIAIPQLKIPQNFYKTIVTCLNLPVSNTNLVSSTSNCNTLVK